jgi:hypothetical protein
VRSCGWARTRSRPSRVVASDRSEPLDAYIARDPVAVLGAATAARFANRLPFLLKVLAAAEPLSIQAHPSLAQAREGFERESRAGVPIDAPHRNYRDANHKPELLCALTPFHALVRFRDPREIADRFAALDESVLAGPVSALRGRPDRDGLAAFFAALWTLRGDARGAVIASAVAWSRSRGGSDPSAHWVATLAQRHAHDVGALAPLLLNVVELAPGEALFLPAGELHSYLEGPGRGDHGQLRQRAARRPHAQARRRSRAVAHADVPRGPDRALAPARDRARRGSVRDAGRGVRAGGGPRAAGRARDRAGRATDRDPARARRAADGSRVPTRTRSSAATASSSPRRALRIASKAT